MIRKGTWALLVLLLALIGLSVFIRDRKARELASATPTAGMQKLFESAGAVPTRMRIENAGGDVVDFSRNQDGKWVLHSPQELEADQAACEAAATQAGSLRVLSTVDLAADIIGLDKPAYTLAITFGDAGSKRLRVGAITPISDGYYVQLDDGPFQVVDKYGLDKLIDLVQSPPIPATATPAASPTAAASETAPATSVETEPPIATSDSANQDMTTATP